LYAKAREENAKGHAGKRSKQSRHCCRC
jgi:hypothetical protein